MGGNRSESSTNQSTLLLSDLWKPCDLALLPLPTQVSLKAWIHLSKHHDSCDLIPNTPLSLNTLEAMIPLLNTKSLCKSGLHNIHQFYNNNKLKTREFLVEEFCLPKTYTLTLTRIPNLLSKHP